MNLNKAIKQVGIERELYASAGQHVTYTQLIRILQALGEEEEPSEQMVLKHMREGGKVLLCRPCEEFVIKDKK